MDHSQQEGPSAVSPPADPACHGCVAPSSALYFRPDGYVLACCATWHLLGRVTGPNRRSLREIWLGDAARQQQDALAADDFGLGCWECADQIGAGRREQSMAASFDRFRLPTPGGYPRFMDFALSNRCNLQCQMCNGGLSSAIRRHREQRPPLPSAYDDRFFEELDEFLPHLEEANFKGGEPFLSREVRRVMDRLIELGGGCRVGITTNGTILNPKIEHYVRRLAPHIQISVDAMDPAVLESIRVGVDAEQLWRNIDRFQELIAESGGAVSLGFCLMADNWSELAPMLAEADRRDVRCDVLWVDGPKSFRLLGRPPDALEEIVDHLRRELASRSLSAASASILADAIDRISKAAATAAEASGDETPVRLGTPATRLDAVRAELAADVADEPFVIEYRHEVAVAITSAPWASWLDERSWEGTGLEEAMTVLATLARGSLRSELEALEGGVHRGVITIEDGVRDASLLAFYVPPEPGSVTSHLLFAPVELAAT